jgi:ABC-type glycerol-3-phosphate transport system permease component
MVVYTAFWLPFTILMMYAYFKTFPYELEEAARIEGCPELGIFFRIVLPISRGAVSSISIVNFVGLWSELLFAFILMNREMMKTITVGVLSFRGEYYVQWAYMFAGLSIASIPAILFFLIFQRQITRGMTAGALK